MNLNTKIPPLIVVLVIILLMYFFNINNYNIDFINISIVFLFLGLFFIISSIIQFIKIKKAVDPTRPEKITSLVKIGNYKIIRNPMYLRMILHVISGAFYFSSKIGIFLVPFFIFYINKFQFESEDFVMLNKFGIEYEN